MRQRRDGGRPRPWRLPYPAQEGPVEVADEAVEAVPREGQRVADGDPQERHDPHADEDLHHDREEVPATYEASVEEGEARGHQSDERR